MLGTQQPRLRAQDLGEAGLDVAAAQEAGFRVGKEGGADGGYEGVERCRNGEGEEAGHSEFDGVGVREGFEAGEGEDQVL